MKVQHCKTPFPFWVIDNFIKDQKFLEGIFTAFKYMTTRDGWWEYDNAFEKKLAFDRFPDMTRTLQKFMSYLNGVEVVSLLTELSGEKGLVADPTLRGGGLHRIQPGGKLDIHTDFNLHPVLKMKRKLNLIFYLNPVWKPSWGGELEFWDADMREKLVSLGPLWNRAVIFDTSGIANHGHPDPLASPCERWSLAAYYYIAAPVGEQPHSTLYRRRPNDRLDLQIEQLRQRRALGRLDPA